MTKCIAIIPAISCSGLIGRINSSTFCFSKSMKSWRA